MKTTTFAEKIDEQQLGSAYELFRALAHPLRMEIISYIARKGETNVQNIYHTLEIPQSVTSQQLKILKDVHLVKFKKQSKERIYTINYKLMAHINSCLNQFF
jgi:DNA-binding transcriptional ArsR family regulator